MAILQQKISDFLALIQSVENNDFANRALESCRFQHSTLGLVTEVIELKRLIDRFDRDPAQWSESFALDFEDEVGDITFYLLQGMDIHGVRPENIPAASIISTSNSAMDRLIYSVGEVSDILKKYLAYDKQIDTTRLLGWYSNIWEDLQHLANDYQIDIVSCINVTMAKLLERYPKGCFSYEDRENRDRDKEKKVMEGVFENGDHKDQQD